MGIFDWLTSSTPATSKTKIPDWIESAGKNLYTQAQGAATQPFTPYTADRVAGLTDTQTSSMDALKALMPQLTGPAGIDMGQVGKFMDPYTQQVIDTTASDMQRSAMMDRENLGNAFHSGGAFGDARQGAYDAEIGKNLASEVGKMSAGLRSQGWNDAVNRLLQEKGLESNQRQQLSSLLGQLYGMGSAEQQTNQAGLDANYAEFLRQQGYPQEQISWLSGVLNGTPYEKTVTQTQAQASPLSQALGAATKLGSAWLSGL